MPQFARPNADIVDGNWTKSTGGNVDLFSMIDEVTADDTDFIQSALAPANDAAAMHLSDVEDPQVSTGHIVRYRFKKSAAAGAQIDLIVQLRQGYTAEATQGTLIHAETHANISDVITAGTFTLTAVEADAITNYNDLQVRLNANQV